MTGLCSPRPLRSIGKGRGVKSDLRRILSKQRQPESLRRAGLDMGSRYWWLILIWVSSVAAYTSEEQTLLNFAAKVDNFQVM